MKRSAGVELVKLFFAFSIAFGHFSNAILPSGTVVTLFFVLSGYFLVNSFESGKYKDAWQYSVGRIKRIYPYYLFAFVVLFLYTAIKNDQTIYRIVTSLATSLPELTMLQNVGIFPGGINYPLWQLCTLVVASHIMFALLQWNKNVTVNVICVVVAIAAFTYLSNAYDTLKPDWWGVEGGFIYIPLLRAVGSLSIGMFLNYPIKRALCYLENSKIPHLQVLMSVVGVAALAVFWINRRSSASVFPFVLLLICIFYSKFFSTKVFQLRLFRKLDKFSLAIYLNHAFIIKLFRDYGHYFSNIPSKWVDVIFLGVLIGYSVIMLFAVDLLMDGFNKLLKGMRKTSTNALSKTKSCE